MSPVLLRCRTDEFSETRKNAIHHIKPESHWVLTPRHLMLPFIVTPLQQRRAKSEKQVSTRPSQLWLNVGLVYYLPFQEIPESGSSPFLFISEYYNNNKAPAEPHLDVREQGLYGGQAFRKDEGSVMETCWELLSRRVRHPLAALPAWRGFLVDLSVTALPASVSGHGAAVWRAERHFHVEPVSSSCWIC